jgi:hypothetical protein
MTRKLAATGQLPLLPPLAGSSSFGGVGGAAGDRGTASRERLELVAASQWGSITAARPPSRLAQDGFHSDDTAAKAGTVRAGHSAGL